MTEFEYRKELKNKLIKYRNTLNLPNDITFGIEIEYENVINGLITYLLEAEKHSSDNLKNWINKQEIDLFVCNRYGEEMNGEINSPILKDNIQTWKDLRLILELLTRNQAMITYKCGGHVNIGAHILGNNINYWRNFLLLWALYEKEIYKFSSGEFRKVRIRKDGTIDRIGPILKENIELVLQDSCDVFEYLLQTDIPFFEKMKDVSLENFMGDKFRMDNRIEFRLPNGTLKEEIWQNYINFFAKFLLTCKKELDIEKIVYKIKHNEHNAIELADLVFEDNIDKENFLIQTLKTNEIYKKELLAHKYMY